MADTLLLDQATWDLTLDAYGNIARATEPYALAQDAASAIKVFAGECYFNTALGINYVGLVFNGSIPALAVLKGLFQNAALGVTDVQSAQVFITGVTNRVLAGQVQVVSATSGQVSAATFQVINPQGVG